MPDLYPIKASLAVCAFSLAIAPFAHSGWNYYRASKLPDDLPELKARRKSMAYEWRGWKIFCTGLALIINTIVDLFP
jgi:hypothetical protein